MKIKQNFTIESAADKLKNELSSHISVSVRKNLLDSNRKWLDIDKDAFIGIRVTFYSDGVNAVTYVPNFFARAFFGGLISFIFFNRSSNAFRKQIEAFLLSEFYE